MKPTLIASFSYKPVILRLGDGTLQAVFPRCGEGVGAERAPYVASEIAGRLSRDNGRTWTEEQILFRLPPAHGGWWGVEGIEAFVDDPDEVHVFILNDARTGVVPSETLAGATTGGEAERPAADTLQAMRFDIWHTKSTDDGCVERDLVLVGLRQASLPRVGRRTEGGGARADAGHIERAVLLRFLATAEETDLAGFCVESVMANVSRSHPTAG